MTSPTGNRAKRPLPDEWSFEITVTFIQVPDEKREAYWATLAWFAEQIKQDLTAPQAMESGQ